MKAHRVNNDNDDSAQFAAQWEQLIAIERNKLHGTMGMHQT